MASCCDATTYLIKSIKHNNVILACPFGATLTEDVTPLDIRPADSKGAVCRPSLQRDVIAVVEVYNMTTVPAWETKGALVFTLLAANGTSPVITVGSMKRFPMTWNMNVQPHTKQITFLCEDDLANTVITSSAV